MLKRTVIVIALLVMLATTAGAAQYPGLIGAAYGNVSSTNMVALVFNASVNQKIAILTYPSYTVLNPVCLLFPMSKSSSAVYGYGNDGFYMVAPISDVYFAACMSSSSSATPRDIFLYSFDLDKYGIMARENKKEPTDEEKAALNQLLQEQLNKLGQTQ
ncbi:MAG: hypothetical protein HQL04_02940 [Nitrospirae bacterium]|nr:hypothetical protein [Nitrospirota bacterium]